MTNDFWKNPGQWPKGTQTSRVHDIDIPGIPVFVTKQNCVKCGCEGEYYDSRSGYKSELPKLNTLPDRTFICESCYQPATENPIQISLIEFEDAMNHYQKKYGHNNINTYVNKNKYKAENSFNNIEETITIIFLNKKVSDLSPTYEVELLFKRYDYHGTIEPIVIYYYYDDELRSKKGSKKKGYETSTE